MAKWALHNLGLKIISLFLAVGCWVYIAWGLGLEKKYVNKTFAGVPVKIFYPARLPLDQKPSWIRATPDTITVTVRGPESQMAGFNPDEISLYIDVSKLKMSPGSYTLPVAINLPEGIELISPHPLPLCEVAFTSERGEK